jgi:hypothetical protein
MNCIDESVYCRHAQCLYVYCHYTEKWHYAEWHSAVWHFVKIHFAKCCSVHFGSAIMLCVSSMLSDVS